MNLEQLKKAIKYLQANCPCINCGKKHRANDINIIASTKIEGLFEVHCSKCQSSSMISVMISKLAESDRPHRNLDLEAKQRQKVSENDILDVKNFLNSFDGNFKKIFKK